MVSRYAETLKELHSFLSRYREQVWAPILEKWITELEHLQRTAKTSPQITEHALRTRRSIGGMGSIGDISITPQPGYRVWAWTWNVSRVNRRLHRLVSALYDSTSPFDAHRP